MDQEEDGDEGSNYDSIIRRSSTAFLSPVRGSNNSFISIAQKSVSSANKILEGIENDLYDANEAMRKRNLHTHNLEELVWLLRKEYNALKVRSADAFSDLLIDRGFIRITHVENVLFCVLE